MPGRQTLVLLGILALGALLRLWTIGDGLPYHPGVDEAIIFDRVAAMMKTGDLHPHLFDYGGFIYYFHLGIAWLRYGVGVATGAMPAVSQVAASDFYLWSRIATALLSTLTIYVVFRAGTRWGMGVAFLAATAMAVQPQLVQSAHHALTDTPLVLFVALTFLLSLRAAESRTYGAFALAGLAAGLATGTKYTGGLAGLMPLAAMVTAVPLSRWPGTAAALFGSAAGAFLAVAPYTVIDLRGFLDGMEKLNQYYNRPSSFALQADLYRKHIQSWFGLPGTLPRSYAWPAMVVMLVGLGAIASGVRTRTGRASAAIVLAFPIAYFVFIANQSLSFGRYAIPMVPVISVGLAAGMVRVYDLAARAPWAAVVARVGLLLLFVPPLLTCVSFNRGRAPLDAREQTAAWLDRSVRPDELFVMEVRYFPVNLPERRFRFRQVERLIEHPLEQYRNDGVTYLIWVNWESDDYFKDPARFAAEIAAHNALLTSTELVQTFTPPPNQPGPTVRVLRIPR
jgi:4-amino-4-deoxy-L-arabinose transferase-like glycosyltransferase